jgi:hypothetical protein
MRLGLRISGFPIRGVSRSNPLTQCCNTLRPMRSGLRHRSIIKGTYAVFVSAISFDQLEDEVTKRWRA